jgi:phenylalanyl-tRNA synthetase beta chain
LAKPAVRELSRFQPVRRDFSLVVPQFVKWADLDSTLAQLATADLPELIDWRVREVLQDNKAGQQAGEYSLLLGTTFQAADRTLRDEELQSYALRVVEAVSSTGARLRS